MFGITQELRHCQGWDNSNTMDTLITVVTFRLYIKLSSFRNLVYQLKSLFTSCNGQGWLSHVRNAPEVPSNPDIRVILTWFKVRWRAAVLRKDADTTHSTRNGVGPRQLAGIAQLTLVGLLY